MKTMSQKELDRLGKKKGFKIKRKMGVQPEKKKPEPVVKDEVALSGAKAAETVEPVPALPLEVNMQPFAAMSASIAASNKNFAELIQKNTETIEAFRTQLAEKASQVKERVSWKHKVKRKDNLIDEVISTPMEKTP